MRDPPFSATFAPGQGKGDSVHATLTLTNPSREPRWLVLRAHLDAPLAEAFDARLVQLCTFEESPTLRYVQALGTATGCIAFWLGPGGSLALDRFAFRSHGGETAFEVWEVKTIHAGDVPVQDCFEGLRPVEEPTSVANAFRRSSAATHERKPCPMRLDVIQRWTVPVALGD